MYSICYYLNIAMGPEIKQRGRTLNNNNNKSDNSNKKKRCKTKKNEYKHRNVFVSVFFFVVRRGVFFSNAMEAKLAAEAGRVGPSGASDTVHLPQRGALIGPRRAGGRGRRPLHQRAGWRLTLKAGRDWPPRSAASRRLHLVGGDKRRGGGALPQALRPGALPATHRAGRPPPGREEGRERQCGGVVSWLRGSVRRRSSSQRLLRLTVAPRSPPPLSRSVSGALRTSRSGALSSLPPPTSIRQRRRRRRR